MNDAGRPLAAVRANKSLGQHFLFDPNILDRVALSAGPVSGRTVIEVGPGPGGLTAALLRNGAAKVIKQQKRTWPREVCDHKSAPCTQHRACSWFVLEP